MQLHLKPCDGSAYPLSGILLQKHSVESWIADIQRMGLSLTDVAVYPLPGEAPNSVGGCLIECDLSRTRPDIGRHSFCRLAHGLLFLPERTALFPTITPAEAEQLLLGRKHLLHPAFGLVDLPPAIDWAKLIELPEERPVVVRSPAPSAFIPRRVKSFQIQPVAIEALLAELEDEYTPDPGALERRPLNPLERAKLAVLKALLSPSGAGGRLPPGLENLPWVQRLQSELEELLERNKRQIDRLVDLLNKDPLEGLKYALPLDERGLGRGGASGFGRLDLSKRWSSFSLFGPSGRGGGGRSAVLQDDAFRRLQDRYQEIARELIRQGDYRKAAFVYLKLLKNYTLAAQTLEEGKYYAEAASVYLRHAGNKGKAAQCYEKGKMILEAIELYKELKQEEKVGDLYLSIARREEANVYFQKVVDRYRENGQYLKAALLCKEKMESPAAAQDLLLQGWRESKDAFNCLNNYFTNLEDDKAAADHLERIYRADVDTANRVTFLRVIKYEYGRRPEPAARIREIAHEIIVAEAGRNPSILSELPHFHREDRQLFQDVMRYRSKVGK